MNKPALCKGCAESVIVTEEVIQELVEEARENPSKIVSEEIYTVRLAACEACQSLQYGTTCAHSGCIVRYRAMFKNKKCPSPSSPKWHSDKSPA
ncbi:hypothetical protein [Mesobacillus foraminis]|uniref:hypothetical protein n=1 Tax=Mesobacillus foraminis TaxID=279826 RepID=UPI000EF446E3|nr:hypothetical protein [Mesobacillus foraminis]